MLIGGINNANWPLTNSLQPLSFFEPPETLVVQEQLPLHFPHATA